MSNFDQREKDTGAAQRFGDRRLFDPNESFAKIHTQRLSS